MMETGEKTGVAGETTPASREQLIERIFAAAQPGAVFAEPVVSGAYTVITASEVGAGGGFGGGSGPVPTETDTPSSGTSQMGGGSGGGGGSAGRPVAAIVIGPDGVKIKPIFDVTKMALAGITAWGAVAIALGRMAAKARG